MWKISKIDRLLKLISSRTFSKIKLLSREKNWKNLIYLPLSRVPRDKKFSPVYVFSDTSQLIRKPRKITRGPYTSETRSAQLHLDKYLSVSRECEFSGLLSLLPFSSRFYYLFIIFLFFFHRAIWETRAYLITRNLDWTLLFFCSVIFIEISEWILIWREKEDFYFCEYRGIFFCWLCLLELPAFPDGFIFLA